MKDIRNIAVRDADAAVDRDGDVQNSHTGPYAVHFAIANLDNNNAELSPVLPRLQLNQTSSPIVGSFFPQWES